MLITSQLVGSNSRLLLSAHRNNVHRQQGGINQIDLLEWHVYEMVFTLYVNIVPCDVIWSVSEGTSRPSGTERSSVLYVFSVDSCDDFQ